MKAHESVSPRLIFLYSVFRIFKNDVFTIFNNFLDNVKMSPNNLFEFAAFHSTVALPLNFFFYY